MGDNAPKECLCPEFKREAVDLCRQSGMGAAQVARGIGIGPNRLTRWWREFEESGRSTYGGRGSARDEEIARLKREISAAQGAGFLTRRRHILRHGIEVRYRAIDAGREQDRQPIAQHRSGREAPSAAGSLVEVNMNVSEVCCLLEL